MGRRGFLVACLLLLLCYFIIYGFGGEGRSVFQEANGIERYMKQRKMRLLLTDSIQSIETEDGDIYNCVDLHKQPALSHPLLKKHKLVLDPLVDVDISTSRLVIHGSVISKRNSIPAAVSQTLEIGFKNGCPKGRIPIRKTTKNDMVVYPYATDGNYAYAGYMTESNEAHNIGATEAYIKIQQPSVKTGQYSSAKIVVRTLNDGPGNIEAGWMVNPDLYGDNRTRMFTSWKDEKKNPSKCFNALCGGFIAVNPRIPLDIPFPQISRASGPHFDTKFVLTQDTYKNWWLTVNENNEKVGYWPRELFSSLQDGADQALWGGEVYNHNSDEFPAMGSGTSDLKTLEESNNNGYFRKIQVTTYYTNEDEPVSVTAGSTSGCYYANDADYRGDYWGISFVFGGSAAAINSTCA